MAPARTRSTFASILRAAASDKFITWRECWKVPGAFCANILSSLLLGSAKSWRRVLETRPNIFSIRKMRGYPATDSIDPKNRKSVSLYSVKELPSLMRRNPMKVTSTEPNTMSAVTNWRQPILKYWNTYIVMTPDTR